MKKILATLFMAVFSFMNSQTNSGTLYFKDGTSKKGLISSPNEIAKGKITFKDENNNVKEIEVSEIEKLDYGFFPFYPIQNNKYYLLTKKIIDDPKVKLYVYQSVDRTDYMGLYNTRNTIVADTYVYFIEMDGKKPEVISSWYDKGITVFVKKANIKYILKYFKDKCPKMADAYKNDEIKFKDNPTPFIEYYINNCSKN
ncbi:hypothetical protein [Chryseobacterium limigenitum]|uniref:DKNYY family protein n=1 Tax=Chryseobacterium limigenitum TaxID=1612149 RepID=A0A1K2ID71_9FLAO|nr:hypothetical protein [Chryseobacterium limigenitum]SFZ90240.1 hypothetical protein SAMN05216324_101272 [Chryseobacterium limigenitum]